MFDRQKSSNGSDEDPYSLPNGANTGSSSSGSRSSGHYVSAGQMANPKSGNGEQKPPKLPPRDFEKKQKQSKSASPKKSSKTNGSSPKDSIAEAENIYGGIGRHARHFGLLSIHHYSQTLFSFLMYILYHRRPLLQRLLGPCAQLR